MDQMFVNDTTGTIRWTYLGNRGVLFIYGPMDAAALGNAIALVCYYSASASPAPRVITWNVGLNHVISSATQHMYYYNITGMPVAWWDAKAACASSTLYNAPGYLANAISRGENAILSRKMAAQAWIGGTDYQQDTMWRWIGGPQAKLNGSGMLFWQGPNSAYDGEAINGAFSAWEPTGVTYVQGEPNGLSGSMYSWFTINGFWAARTNNDPGVDAFVCEFGDATHAIPTNVWGVVTLQTPGCVPVDPIQTACLAQMSATECGYRDECTWLSNNSCVKGCAWITDPFACSESASCHLDLDSVPAVCTQNVCDGSDDCTNPLCVVIDGKCQYNVECSRFVSQSACEDSTTASCQWDSTTNECSRTSLCSNYMTNNSCVADACQSNCYSDPSCDFFSNLTVALCIQKRCDSLSSRCNTSVCNLVQSSSTSSGPVYRPGAAPVAVFTSAPAVASPFGFVVSITSGFSSGDQLIFFASRNPAFSATYYSAMGMLLVAGTANATEFQNAVLSLKFVTSTNDGNARSFSWAMLSSPSSSIGPVYLPQFGRIVEFVPADQISYGAAQSRCAARTLSGSSGTLLTISSLAQQQAYATVLNAGVNGWIGAKAVPTGSSATWMWDIGTADSGTVFFRGDASLGTAVSFENWGASEPAAVRVGTFRFAMLTPSGSWISDQAASSQAGGFFCSYPAPPASSNAVGTTTLSAVGCFQKPCSYSDADACQLDPTCAYVNNVCIVSPCYPMQNVTSCNTIGGCYYSATTQACLKNPADACSEYDNSADMCTSVSSQCGFFGGHCGTVGCLKYSDSASCNNDMACLYSDGTCVKRLCGYLSQQLCVTDTKCQWANDGCSAAQCVGSANRTSCLKDTACSWSDNMVPACVVDKCQYTDFALCIGDDGCMWSNNNCTRNVCPVLDQSSCATGGNCTWDTANAICTKDVCFAQTQVQCESITRFLTPDATTQSPICVWTNVSVQGTDGFNFYCSTKSIDQLASLAAAGLSQSEPCVDVPSSSTPLMVALVVSLVLLAIVLIVMVRMQASVRESSGLDFNKRMYDSNSNSNSDGEDNAEMMREEEERDEYEPPQVARPDFNAL